MMQGRGGNLGITAVNNQTNAHVLMSTFQCRNISYRFIWINAPKIRRFSQSRGNHRPRL
jgi:hypothetical protein